MCWLISKYGSFSMSVPSWLALTAAQVFLWYDVAQYIQYSQLYCQMCQGLHPDCHTPLSLRMSLQKNHFKLWNRFKSQSTAEIFVTFSRTWFISQPILLDFVSAPKLPCLEPLMKGGIWKYTRSSWHVIKRDFGEGHASTWIWCLWVFIWLSEFHEWRGKKKTLYNFKHAQVAIWKVVLHNSSKVYPLEIQDVVHPKPKIYWLR